MLFSRLPKAGLNHRSVCYDALRQIGPLEDCPDVDGRIAFLGGPVYIVNLIFQRFALSISAPDDTGRAERRSLPQEMKRTPRHIRRRCMFSSGRRSGWK